MSWVQPGHPLSSRHRSRSKIKAVAAPAHAPVFDIAGIEILDSDRPVDAKVAGISPVVVDGAVVEVDPEEFGVVTRLRYPVSGKHRQNSRSSHSPSILTGRGKPPASLETAMKGRERFSLRARRPTSRSSLCHTQRIQPDVRQIDAGGAHVPVLRNVDNKHSGFFLDR
jgi:hypothetical protein